MSSGGQVNFTPCSTNSSGLFPDPRFRPGFQRLCENRLCASFWIAVQYGIEMELGERALGFGYH